MMRHYYGIAYAYGRSVINGALPDFIYRFDNKSALLRWLDAGDRVGEDRDALPATHKLVKQALRYAALGMDWPQAV